MANEILGEHAFSLIKFSGNFTQVVEGVFTSIGIVGLFQNIYHTIAEKFLESPSSRKRAIINWIKDQDSEEAIEACLYDNGDRLRPGTGEIRRNLSPFINEIYNEIAKQSRYIPNGISMVIRPLVSIICVMIIAYKLAPEIPNAIFYSRHVLKPLPGFGSKRIDKVVSNKYVSTLLSLLANGLLYVPILNRTLLLLYTNMNAVFNCRENGLPFWSKVKISWPLVLTVFTLLTIMFQSGAINPSLSTL